MALPQGGLVTPPSPQSFRLASRPSVTLGEGAAPAKLPEILCPAVYDPTLGSRLLNFRHGVGGDSRPPSPPKKGGVGGSPPTGRGAPDGRSADAVPTPP